MQNDPAKSNRAKWMLVAVLGVVFTSVVAWRLLPTESAKSENTAASEARGDEEESAREFPRRLPAKGISLTATTKHIETKWPTIPLTKIVAHDPFAPESLPGVATVVAASGNEAELAAAQERAALLAGTLDALRERGVSVVLHTSKGPVATIGDRMIKVGDKVGDYHVAEIDADGVVLEAAAPK
jgi:hypothetical protein